MSSTHVEVHPLVELRQSAGLSQRQLAQRADLAPHTVSRIERGIHQPTDRVRLRLARALGVEPQDIAPYLDSE
jgi:transcriptional regulator with XRE-family HTH domain